MAPTTSDAHRHIGVLPAYPFYGGPAINPDTTARATISEFMADVDAEQTDRALVLPNYGVPLASAAFDLNPLAIEAAQQNERIVCGLWVSPRPEDILLTENALKLAGEQGVRALKTSFLLGGSATDEACASALDRIFETAKLHDLVVHVHTSPGGASDIDQVGTLVEKYGDDVKIHLVHLGGGMSGNLKLIGGRLFDWIAAGKKVYTDTSWTIGFAPRWLVQEIERRGFGEDRILFASDAPWGDHEGEYARMHAAVKDTELADLFLRENFATLYA
ncbi:amidohydrolase [Subtercola boreus]|uniref:Amidohydrolase n=1 Tax=Subtercola boreus TaxID=120213 RepID=A0A3E0W1W6_9MICO|nr:amidohydrolase family protein [Subtercola boreus]RFA15077.1 amidohydrolase [Subtercola boreus]